MHPDTGTDTGRISPKINTNITWFPHSKSLADGHPYIHRLIGRPTHLFIQYPGKIYLVLKGKGIICYDPGVVGLDLGGYESTHKHVGVLCMILEVLYVLVYILVYLSE